ncbi:hypothetical protein FRC12_019024 [Ceratobasidium sp. 428]|nr:hypothetical protein FRC12_019024 [Ceratobasidium sp. 428]
MPEEDPSSTDDQVPPIPLSGPDRIGPYSPFGHGTPNMAPSTSYTPSRAQSPTPFDSFAAAAAARNAARSRSPTPNLLGSPMYQIPLPLSPASPSVPVMGLPTLDHIRDRLGDRLGANVFRSNSAAARMTQGQGATGIEEHLVPLPPTRVNTPATIPSRVGTPGSSLGRSNTTGGLMVISPGGAGAGDRNAARRELFKKIGGRVEKDRGGDGDQTSGAEDTVLMNGRVTPFRSATPGGGMRSPTPGAGMGVRVQTPTPRVQTPGGGDDGGSSSAPGTPTPGKSRRRSHGRRKSRSSGVNAVVDDRDEPTQPAPTAAPSEPAPASTTKPDGVMVYNSPKPPLNQVLIPIPQNDDDDDDDDDDATGAKGLARQRSVKLERDKALLKLAGGMPSRVGATQTHRPPLVEEEDDEVPALNAPSYLGLPTPLASSTPQPRVPHSSDMSVQSGSSIPVFVAEQGTLSPYKLDTFPVTISQYHKDGMPQVAEDVEDHEVEEVVYPEDPSTKARRTFIEALDRNGGSKADLTLGSEMFRITAEVQQDDDDDDENDETDREAPPFQSYAPIQRAPAESWVSRPSTEAASSPRAETSTLPPSTPSTAVFSGSARPEDLHGSSGSLVSHTGFPAAASSTSHSSSGQGQAAGGTASAHSLTDWEEVVDNDVPVQPKRVPKKETARGWQQKMMTGIATLGRSASRAEGRRSRTNSFCGEYGCDGLSYELTPYDWTNGPRGRVSHVVDRDADGARWGVARSACVVQRPTLGGRQAPCVSWDPEARGGEGAQDAGARSVGVWD